MSDAPNATPLLESVKQPQSEQTNQSSRKTLVININDGIGVNEKPG